MSVWLALVVVAVGAGLYLYLSFKRARFEPERHIDYCEPRKLTCGPHLWFDEPCPYCARIERPRMIDLPGVGVVPDPRLALEALRARYRAYPADEPCSDFTEPHRAVPRDF